jgi:HlyD family secretion protein
MSRNRSGPGRVLREVFKGLGILILLVVLMIWLSGAFVEKVNPGPPQRKPAPPPALETYTVNREVFPLMIQQVGTVRSRNEAQVSSRIMAQVRNVYVQEGDAVVGPISGKGPSQLAKLDDRDIRAQLSRARSQVDVMERGLQAAKAKLEAARAHLTAAQANARKALSDYRRYEALRRNQAATGQQLEHARAQKEAAEAQVRAARQEIEAGQGEVQRLEAQLEQAGAAVREAQVLLSYTLITAPFSGRVVAKRIQVGDMVSPGQTLFILETSSQPELHAMVSESLLPHVHVAEEMPVTIDALAADLHGKVREIVPMADPASRTVVVKVSLPSEPELITGMFGRLYIPYGEYEALIIPRRSVREVGQLRLVEVLDASGHPARRFVTLGKEHGRLVEVLSGLKAGEQVVMP